MSSNPYARRVHRVMDYVRRHMADDLTLDDLAQVAHFSPYHFHRVFKATAGETVAQFTRRARLERAAYLMKAAPERELGSIALEVGFSSQSDFSRVFRRHYGVAPSAWDRRSRLDGDARLAPTAVEVERNAREPFRARILQHPACRLAYVRMRAAFVGDVLQRGYRVLTEWLDERGVDWRQCELVGLSWDNYETTPLDKVRFDFGFAVPDGVVADGEIGVHVFAAMRSVAVHCRGPLSRIAAAWDYLYDDWLPRSRYEPDDLPAIKRFRARPDELGWDTWDLDCTIPIRPMRP